MDITSKTKVCYIPFYLSLSVSILQNLKVFIVIPLSTFIMAEFGFRTSFYAQEELMKEVDKTIEKFPGLFQSRSHFINCAIVRELRHISEQAPGLEPE